MTLLMSRVTIFLDQDKELFRIGVLSAALRTVHIKQLTGIASAVRVSLFTTWDRIRAEVVCRQAKAGSKDKGKGETTG